MLTLVGSHDGTKYNLDGKEFMTGVKLAKQFYTNKYVFDSLTEQEKKLFNAGWQIEPAYLQNIFYHFPEFELTPFSIDGVITAAAVWFGILAGTILTHRTLPLGRIQASTTQLILRFIIGTIGVAAIWMGLKLVFPDDDTLVSQVLRFVRYGFLGLWVTAAAPYLFKKIGLER